ncbi:MAG: hypothetical protein L0J68_11915 [Micrococcaceae bacterium]|uniref:hypothetical protein n=1 Tax=Arthrobacter sp. 179 TaxID=3457734 RepID=UPI00264FA396|nr:hypothetical protein [Micrococcaceae bacterium]
MRTTSALKTAALLIVSVVLALGSVQGSLAVWNTATGSGAGTVQAADFAVLLKTASGNEQRLSANGAPATVTLPAVTNLQPGESRTLPVAVTNATNAGSGAFRIRLTASPAVVSGAKTPGLAATAGISTTGNCSGQTSATVDLAQNGQATLCVKVTLQDKVPATSGGQTNSVSVKLAATQL